MGGTLELYQCFLRSGETANVSLNSGTTNAGFIVGHAKTGSDCYVTGLGSCQGFAFGYAGGPSSPTSSILATSKGSFAQGYAKVSFGLKSTATGAFTQGYSSSGKLYASGKGSFAQGSTKSQLRSYEPGCFAQGYTDATSNILSGYTGGTNTKGCFAQGFAEDNSDIVANDYGSFAQGYASGYSFIQATGAGTFAQGYAKNSGHIIASADGAMASGFTYGYASGSAYTAKIEASGIASFAHGLTRTIAGESTNILASGKGSFSHGISYSSDHTASGIGSVVFCTDVNTSTKKYTGTQSNNSVKNSVMIGGKYPIRLIGSGPPASPQNGDFWVAGNYIWIQSGGRSTYVWNLTM